ncbi:pyridoxamine 5'-phosphate oxidase family protein [Pseudonocardia xishanensis]|uniref:Pyridoxamine 5'-phosphate oxidase family protein n=1 Tax=Pseudonocardia xishanensis TaxID=630995 RepID=A0ABP8S107_9PSEU
MSSTEQLPQTPDTRVHRYRWLQRESRQDLYDVLDAALVAHVGFATPDGRTMVIPMGYARVDDAILMHGSTGAGLNRNAKTGVDLTATITVLDGLVFAESLFDSTLNYRCAMVFGTADPVADEEKEACIKAISDRLMPGRWEEVRPPTTRELAATYVLRLPLDKASVKVREGGPDGDVVDGLWTGHVPFVSSIGEPIVQEGVGAAAPASVANTLARFRG